MAFRTAVPDSLRHTVLLFQNDVLPEIPAVSPECESQKPGYPKQVLLFIIGIPVWQSAVYALRWRVRLFCIAVAHVQPQRSIRAKNTADFPEDWNQSCQIFLRCFFHADLTVCPVIAVSKIGRGSDAGVDAVTGERPKLFQCVPAQNCACHISLMDGAGGRIRLRSRRAFQFSRPRR